MNRRRGEYKRAHQQRGVAFYLFVILASSILATLLLQTGNFRTTGGQSADMTLLQKARDALIAQLMQPSLYSASGRLGEFSSFPDLPIAIGAGIDNNEPSYDGMAESIGCAYRNWISGRALSPVSAAGAEARCFGQLPWRELGLAMPGAQAIDRAGEIPWLIASPNLAIGRACLANLNRLILGQLWSGGYACPSALPYRWLELLDDRGNIISNRVAFALILPGPALSGQQRTATSGPEAYLDSLTVATGCAQPCQPGRIDNANYRHANNQAWQIVSAPIKAGEQEFNDVVLFVTIDELMSRLEIRARKTLLSALEAFKLSNHYYPFAARFDDDAARCSNGVRFGHPAIADGDCGANLSLDLPSWFADAGWHRYFVYAVSPRCVAGDAACNTPSLSLDGRQDDDANALLFSSGTAIVNPPYASSMGSAQRPIQGNLLANSAAHWLDNPENAAGLADVFVSPAPAASPDNDHLIKLQ